MWNLNRKRVPYLIIAWDGTNAFASTSHAALDLATNAQRDPDDAAWLRQQYRRSLIGFADESHFFFSRPHCGDFQGSSTAPKRFAAAYDIPSDSVYTSTTTTTTPPQV